MSAKYMPSAKPYKLKNGSWGAQVNGTVKPGEQVCVCTRHGKEWIAIVRRVIASGHGQSLVSLVK
jgi:hypothetical protein